MLTFFFVSVGVLMLDLATSPPLVWTTILFMLVMGLLGLGNGAVFQLVPQRFPEEIGVVTGIVGAAGGIGGFLLPTLLGGMKELTGSYSGAFFILALVAFSGAVALVYVSQFWEGAFVDRAGRAMIGSAQPVNGLLETEPAR